MDTHMHMTQLCADPVLCFLKNKLVSWCLVCLSLCYVRLDYKILSLSLIQKISQTGIKINTVSVIIVNLGKYMTSNSYRNINGKIYI